MKRVVDLHTKVFCFLDYFEFIVTNFQIQISTFDDAVPLLGGNKLRSFFTFKESSMPSVQLFEIAINGLIW